MPKAERDRRVPCLAWKSEIAQYQTCEPSMGLFDGAAQPIRITREADSKLIVVLVPANFPGEAAPR